MRAIYVLVWVFTATIVFTTFGNAEARTRYNFSADSRSSQISSYTGKTTTTFKTSYKPGTIIIDTSDRALYYITGKNQAIKYGVGVGRKGFQWSGASRISRKAKWPGWTPPAIMRKRQPGLPKYMPGGPRNPLGARALYLGASLYRIHGTNNRASIGRAMSSGCIRMLNEEVIELYSRVKIGTRVIVRR